MSRMWEEDAPPLMLAMLKFTGLACVAMTYDTYQAPATEAVPEPYQYPALALGPLPVVLLDDFLGRGTMLCFDYRVADDGGSGEVLRYEALAPPAEETLGQ